MPSEIEAPPYACHFRRYLIAFWLRNFLLPAMTDVENPADDEQESQSRRQKVKGFMYVLSRGARFDSNPLSFTPSKDEFLKGKLKLEHSLGLGNKPNAIPPADPDIKGPQRTVHLGWHPVAGFAGKWFAEKTGLGKLITEKTHRCPDPTQHWAVLVDEYAHELWMVSSHLGMGREMSLWVTSVA